MGKNSYLFTIIISKYQQITWWYFHIMYTVIRCHKICIHIHIVCIMMLVGVKKGWGTCSDKFVTVKQDLPDVILCNLTLCKNITVELSEDCSNDRCARLSVALGGLQYPLVGRQKVTEILIDCVCWCPLCLVGFCGAAECKRITRLYFERLLGNVVVSWYCSDGVISQNITCSVGRACCSIPMYITWGFTDICIWVVSFSHVYMEIVCLCVCVCVCIREVEGSFGQGWKHCSKYVLWRMFIKKYSRHNN